jgi:hypothetical protein
MRLRYATFGVIIATIYLFILRSVGTVFVDVFDSYDVVYITQILAFCAGVTFVVFFYLFYSDYAKPSQPVLRIAALGAFIGTGLILILHLRNLCIVFRWYDIPLLLDLQYIEMLFPYVGSVSLVFFFVVFRKTVIQEKRNTLLRPTLSGLIGACIQLSLVSLMTVNYLMDHQGVSLPDTHRIVGIFIMPVVLLQFAAYLYFYGAFHREIKKHESYTTGYNSVIQE